MVFTRILKIRLTPILITLFVVLQISACGTEDIIATSTAQNTNPGIETGTNTINAADVNLAWTAPSEREDNSAISLSEIAGYIIYYGTTQGLYPNTITVNDSSADSHILTNLPAAGTYFVVVTAIDTDGRESQYSTEIMIET